MCEILKLVNYCYDHAGDIYVDFGSKPKYIYGRKNR